MSTQTTSAGASVRPARGVRFAARSAAAVVALVAGAASFEHIASVAIRAGERAWVGYSLPFAIDGLIVVGVAALLEDQRRGLGPRRSARLAVLVGVVATLAANVASAEPTWTARLVALAAPVSFLIAVEVLTRSGRQLSTTDDTGNASDSNRASEPPATPATQAAAARPRKRTSAGTGRRRPSARERVVTAVRNAPDATSAQIAAKLNVSERTVQRYWPQPANGDTDPTPGNGNGAGGNGQRPELVSLPAGALRRTDHNGANPTGR